MGSLRNIFYVLCLCIFILIIFLLPRFSFEDYSISLNSISQLGGQWHPYAWVMNIFGFMLMGLGIVVLYLKIPLSLLSKTLVLAFGVLMIAVGFFQHEPVAGYGIKSVVESNMHSIIANVMGITITLFAISLIFDKKATKYFKAMAFLAGLVSSLLSLGLVVFPDYYGYIQRAMFMLILYWLFYVALAKQDNSTPIQSNIKQDYEK